MRMDQGKLPLPAKPEACHAVPRDSMRTTPKMIDPLPSSPRTAGRVSTRVLALRSLACGFALSAAVVAGASHLDAQTFASTTPMRR
jgi:hypothetical protein